MNRRGFTLIELLIVVSVIGVLAAVATTAYIGTMKQAARSEAYSSLQNLRLLEEQYFAENAIYVAANTGPLILAALPGFNPGGSPPGSGINFTYKVTNTIGVGLPSPVPIPYNNAVAPLNNATTPCFIATASGIANTRVCPNAANCDVFAIDCNNNRNF